MPPQLLCVLAIALLGIPRLVLATLVCSPRALTERQGQQIFIIVKTYAVTGAPQFRPFGDAPTHGKVTNLPGYGQVKETQYAGYIGLNDTDGSQLFYWFIAADAANWQVRCITFLTLQVSEFVFFSCLHVSCLFNFALHVSWIFFIYNG